MHGEEDPRGMGMFLIQALVDEAEWVAGTEGKSSYVRLVIRLDKDAVTTGIRQHELKQQRYGDDRKCKAKPKSRVDQLTSPAGHPVTVLRFEGDIASTSKDAVLGTYQALPKDTAKLVLLDFSKVDYINSSGIALVIQMLIEASNSGQKVYAFGLSRALHQGLHHGGHHQIRRAVPRPSGGAGGAVRFSGIPRRLAGAFESTVKASLQLSVADAPAGGQPPDCA